eukprot:TRINITY_DN18575_c2_g1_i1.p1 TRINITY_DN18575_c2_g1~~TRINITY_DN18575_c2_g1_i1.p1  ORF type:complete len:516 (+),score=89.31 TRINITY_DN18575_c2_g1_i1:126-1673(+)
MAELERTDGSAGDGSSSSTGSFATSEVQLDKAKFEEKFSVLALKIPKKQTGEFLKRLKAHTLNVARRKNVEPCPGETKNFVLLARDLKDVSDLPVSEKEWLQGQLSSTQIQLTSFEVRLDYDHFTVEEVLKKLLPAGMEVPTSFEQAGHICHVNLRDSQLPFRYLIARIILDKNKSVKTVVNKTGKIETAFRTFPMEVLGGDPSTVVRLREQQCWFEFEYRDVYWNSRLHEEHQRLVEALFVKPVSNLSNLRCKPVLADCTCGVGPFSLPVVKQTIGLVSHANDLNPESIRWLTRNAEINKLPHVNHVSEMPPSDEKSLAPPQDGSRLVIHAAGDARHFVRALYQERHSVTHAIFNLPATGVELLDCFCGLDYTERGLPRPLICCYTFSDAAIESPGDDGCVAQLLRRVAAALGVPIESFSYVGLAGNARLALPSPQVVEMIRAAESDPEKTSGRTAIAVRLVRNVAPSKHMFCVCFRVPEQPAASVKEVSPAAESEPLAEGAAVVPPEKKAKLT